MPSFLPKFGVFADGSPRLDYSAETKSITKRPQTNTLAWPEEKVGAGAISALRTLDGDPRNGMSLLGQCRVQFGLFQGQKFLWCAENTLGWAAYVCVSLKREIRRQSPISANKFSLMEYIKLFDLGKRAIEKKEKKSQKMQVVFKVAASVQSQLIRGNRTQSRQDLPLLILHLLEKKQSNIFNQSSR